MSDLVELLNELNQSNRIEYSDYSQLMFCVQQLEEENEQLKRQIKEIMNNELRLVKQIEKMKCCNNCKLYQCEEWKNNEINYHFAKCENWELAE